MARRERIGLNEKQRRFVAEYLVDLNETQAAIRAGYSPRTAASQASRLLTKAKVKAAVAEKQSRLAGKLEVTAERVIRELARIGFSDFADVATWGPGGVKLVSSGKLTEDQRRAVAEVGQTISETGGSLKIKFHDKVKALEDLGKHLGLFVDKHELSGPNGSPVPIAGFRIELVEAKKQVDSSSTTSGASNEAASQGAALAPQREEK